MVDRAVAERDRAVTELADAGKRVEEVEPITLAVGARLDLKHVRALNASAKSSSGVDAA